MNSNSFNMLKSNNMYNSLNYKTPLQTNIDGGKFKRKSIAKVNDIIAGLEIPWTRDLEMYGNHKKFSEYGRHNIPDTGNSCDTRRSQSTDMFTISNNKFYATANTNFERCKYIDDKHVERSISNANSGDGGLVGKRSYSISPKEYKPQCSVVSGFNENKYAPDNNQVEPNYCQTHKMQSLNQHGNHIPCHYESIFSNYQVMHPHCKCYHQNLPCQYDPKLIVNQQCPGIEPLKINHGSLCGQERMDRPICPLRKSASYSNYQTPCWTPNGQHSCVYNRKSDMDIRHTGMCNNQYYPTNVIPSCNQPYYENQMSQGHNFDQNIVNGTCANTYIEAQKPIENVSLCPSKTPLNLNSSAALPKEHIQTACPICQTRLEITAADTKHSVSPPDRYYPNFDQSIPFHEPTANKTQCNRKMQSQPTSTSIPYPLMEALEQKKVYLNELINQIDEKKSRLNAQRAADKEMDKKFLHIAWNELRCRP